MADINTAIDNIVTQVAAAAAALTNAITDVSRGDPIPSASGRSIRVWYSGEAAPPMFHDASTLNSILTGEVVKITCYWPISTSEQALAAARDKEIYSLKHGIRTNILAHSTLSGTVTDLEMSHGQPVFAVHNGTPFRGFEFDVTLTYNEYPITA